jgi:hypothetical protein
MTTKIILLGKCRVEVLLNGDEFLGLGAAYIGDVQVRSGRLPLRPYTQTFTGHELAGLRFRGVETAGDTVRICLEATFRPLPVKLMRDHSFDPIHELSDWDAPAVSGTGRLDLVLRTAADAVCEYAFEGFSYSYEYHSADTPIFYLLDMASWELDGDIVGATVYSQSSCSAPVATFAPETAWTTEGIIHWVDEAAMHNRNMTHNLPRWASHGSFDFQCKGNATLLGIFDHVDLVRTTLRREPGKAELKCLDKHIFDETKTYATTPKAILLNTDPKSITAQQNLWTWTFDLVHGRARAEFGLQEEPLIPRISQNYWGGFTVDSYRRDLLPAAVNLGVKQLFIDNMNKSAATEGCPGPNFSWNMCCGHEYEPAPKLGGEKALKRFIDDCATHGIRPFAWTNNDQALSSPVNDSERDEKNWFVRMEDTRLKYGGAYGNVFSILNFQTEGPRRYWVDSLKKIKETTGLDGYLFDSFYNLGLMPVDYRTGHPSTMWRGTLAAFKELQDAGVNFLIESFGPFGQPQHGCPKDYNVENIFACYKVGLGTGYTTIPTGIDTSEKRPKDASVLYFCLAHMTDPGIPLFIQGQRIDTLWGDEHKRALADYHAHRAQMCRRFLQEDGQAVLWHNADGTRATLWNFATREVALPGTVTDLTTGEALPAAGAYTLQAFHTYAVAGAPLPTAVAALVPA